ncbi:MAG: amidoligase family protein [Victivallaceae bacterium]|nr:amidoligase family protein [Victivallaceae bacterium]
MNINEQTFGTELEYVRISRQKAAEAIQSVVGGQVRYVGGPYDAWECRAENGQTWKCVNDSSLIDAPSNRRAEVVTPILKYENIETLQQVVRALRHAGARATSCCSQHVHLGMEDSTPEQVANLAKMFYKQEELILKALGTSDARLNQYTRRTDDAFINRISRRKPRTDNELNEAWFGYRNPNPAHYDHSRYRDLNLANLWRIKTAEVRCAEGSTHSGEIKSVIIFCLALAVKAKNSKAASAAKREYNPASAKYDFRVFLLRLGLSGKEFKNVRYHLLKRLPGSAAWKHGRPTATA